MKIAIGSDHRGFSHKEFIKKNVTKSEQQIEWIDVGCFSDQSCDYPEFANAVVAALKSGQADVGILLCGSGVGMAIAANRHKKIYAAQVWNKATARISKENDNANILVFGADFIAPQQSVFMIQEWLSAKFLGGRHEKRLQMIDN